MPPKPPVVLAKKGAVPVDPAAVQQNQHQQHGKQHQQQPKNTARLKLLVRRLPPALTQDEFLHAFGDEWKVPGDKIDWLEYRPGKVKGPGKLSLQSRAYVHLTAEHHIKPFEAKFLSLSFHDAKGSYKDVQLKNFLPSLAFAPNQRIPSHKQRLDGRQGTIDQDPEFIAFLERETQPVTKPLSLDQALAQEKPKEKVASTPLLDDLREKKQSKARANAKNKDEKLQDKASARGRGAEKQDAKQPVKVLAKNQKAQTAQSPAPASPAQSAPASARKRDRVAPNQIKSMLQRDLGLNQQPSKRGRKDASPATATKTTSPAPPASESPAPATSAPAKSAKSRSGRNKDKANAQPAAQENTKPASPAPTGILKKPAQQPTPKPPKAKANASTPAAATPSPSPSPAPSNKPPKTPSQPSTGATKAYLKHANASQGVTEPLLLTALSAFGPVVKVEIDKRKGTALAEFKDTEGLKAAMAKKNVPVAQGAVEVLEFREKPAPGGRGANARGAAGNAPNRGRGGRARAGAANAAANAPAPAPAANGKPDAT